MLTRVVWGRTLAEPRRLLGSLSGSGLDRFKKKPRLKQGRQLGGISPRGLLRLHRFDAATVRAFEGEKFGMCTYAGYRADERHLAAARVTLQTALSRDGLYFHEPQNGFDQVKLSKVGGEGRN